MGSVLLCGYPPDDTRSADHAHSLRHQAAGHGLDIVDLSSCCWVGLGGPRPPSMLKVGPWILIGDIIPRRHAPVHRISADDPDAYEKKLLARYWGRYLGVRLAPSGEVVEALRDPSGALECARWSHQGLTFLASDIPDWLVKRTRPPWRIAFDRLAAALPAPHLASDLFLDGPEAMAPGTIQPLPTGHSRPLWRPAWIAADRSADRLTRPAAERLLREAVEEAVSGLADLGGPLAAEISGGLDSAIVSACLANRDGPVPLLWLNSFGPDPAADEGSFVEALAARLGISPTRIARQEGSVTRQDLEAMPHRLRPGLAALDSAHDGEWAKQCRQAGARAVLTGKGGDALLVQPASMEVFGDLWRRQGWRSIVSPALPALARLNERSVWTVLGRAIHPERPRPRLHPPIPLGPTPPAPVDPHPWLEHLEGLGPAKRTQILGLIHSLTFHGPSLQTQAVEVLHPLLAQPVVEACLALSTPQLTAGRRDRALARAAFADRLPPEILERRSKGEMTAFYGRMIGRSLYVLRPWLLEGRLADKGVIDRATVEALLTRESLAWRGGYVEIMTAAAFEGWVRAWEARLPVTGPSPDRAR